MSEIKIDTDVPIPRRRNKYPWAGMKVGDSFLIPGKCIQKVSGLTSAGARCFGGKYTARTVEGGVRIWRIE